MSIAITRALRIFSIASLLLLASLASNSRLSMPGVRAQNCQVLSETVTESGNCIYVSTMLGCSCPPLNPCAEVHFCSTTFCDSGSSFSLEIYCF
ncbi:MAG: hypothetical protein JMDDDDMK_03658 [Acidobacteria bacterium]|nr:hypothetical protein [Acidobacteriota bacterium]